MYDERSYLQKFSMGQDISVEAEGDSPVETQSERNQLVGSLSEQDYRQGSLNARVVLVEYGDYQCPQCGELYALIKTIHRSLNGTFLEEN